MPRAPLFFLLLLLLLLGLGGSSPIPAVPVADAGALLAELEEQSPPRVLPGAGVSCQDLRPDVLPGFSRLPPLPRALARAAMALALSGAACGAQAQEEARGLSQELGPPRATALLRGLARLRDTPAPQVLPLLLSLVGPGCSAPQGPCAASPRRPTPGSPARGLPAEGARGVETPAWLPACRHARRRRREEEEEEEEEDACNPPGEREAHGVLEWVPGVSTFYSLGSSLYYAFQGCEGLASARALEVAEDLGYAGLAAIAAGAGGPVALGIQMGLQPGIKAGVRALIGYFTSQGDPPPPPAAHSGPVLVV
ncbi:APOF protein, partial [Rostratula benghalensis]|nr:APOF protein [Rostratula benghalensis]